MIENIANSACLPAIGAYMMALAIKIENGSEALIRLIGITNKLGSEVSASS